MIAKLIQWMIFIVSSLLPLAIRVLLVYHFSALSENGFHLSYSIHTLLSSDLPWVAFIPLILTVIESIGSALLLVGWATGVTARVLLFILLGCLAINPLGLHPTPIDPFLLLALIVLGPGELSLDRQLTVKRFRE